DTLAQKYSPATVTRALSYLAAVYAWAVKDGLVPTNPLRGLERPAAQSSREFLGRDEAAAQLHLATVRATGGPASAPLFACVLLALHTGLRKGELLGLRWQDVDLPTLRLTVARSYKTTPKSGQARHLRLPAACVPVLQAWKLRCPKSAGGEGLLFPIARG